MQLIAQEVKYDIKPILSPLDKQKWSHNVFNLFYVCVLVLSHWEAVFLHPGSSKITQPWYALLHMGKVNTILFDLDGTLVDNSHLYRQALEASLQSSGVAGLTREQVSSLLESKALAGDLRILGIDAALARRIEEKRDERVGRLFSTCTYWMPGAEAFLQAASLQVSTGLVTNTWRRFVDAIDSKLHLQQYFRVIVSGETTEGRYKPDPFGISLALAQLGASPEQAVYIGNDTSDMVASVQAGVRGIFISDKGECGEAYLHVQKWAELSLGDLLED